MLKSFIQFCVLTLAIVIFCRSVKVIKKLSNHQEMNQDKSDESLNLAPYSSVESSLINQKQLGNSKVLNQAILISSL